MTITEMVKNQQQQRIGELNQRQQGKPHVNPYGTPGMSLNDAGDYRKIVPVDEGVVQQIKQIALDHMKKGYDRLPFRPAGMSRIYNRSQETKGLKKDKKAVAGILSLELCDDSQNQNLAGGGT